MKNFVEFETFDGMVDGGTVPSFGSVIINLNHIVKAECQTEDIGDNSFIVTYILSMSDIGEEIQVCDTTNPGEFNFLEFLNEQEEDD